MKRVFMYAYKNYSESAKMLAEACGIKRISHRNSKFRTGLKKTVINWGSTEMSAKLMLCHVVNHPYAVYQALSKSRSLLLMKNHNVRVPPFSFDRSEAEKWVMEGSVVLARILDKSKGGKGIVVCDGEKPPEAHLYVKYVKSREEWRVHVAFGRVIDIQKKLAPDKDKVKDWRIRSWSNGFTFRRHGVRPPMQDVLVQAVRAVDALGLDFGGVDVIWNEKERKAYVLEVNTAPGLEGQTVESYRKAIEEYIRENGNG